ncbi:MAG TPA: YggS family pyridoxal phosphate-dependent enzyme [Candidatus Dormibacteraeota bacterium]|jgi:pyridoxal phosphate enzyme (YggS family)
MDQLPVSANLARIQSVVAASAGRVGRDPDGITLVAVTKGMAAERVREGIGAGLKTLGENRIQEALPKIEEVGAAGIEWHLIGHLQRNKTRFIEGNFQMVQSIDSLELLEALDRRLTNSLEVLIEVNVADEPQKTGATTSSVLEIARATIGTRHLRLRGLMTIAPQSPHPELARPVFKRLASVSRELAERLQVPLPVLSMGMTDDYAVAVEEGSTMLRLGRAIFGSR